MGRLSISRSLLIRQSLLTILVVALGGFAYSNIQELADLVRGLGRDGNSAALAHVVSGIDSAAYRVALATFAAAAVMIMVSLPMVYVTTCRPIKALADAIDRLAAGDVSVEIAGEHREDELGVIARGLQRIRTDAADRAIVAAREADAASEAVNTMRAKIIADRVESFSSDLSSMVNRLSQMTTRLSEAADKMIRAARSASEGSQQATGASTNAATDVSSVAAASEQLLDSIEEISRQVVQSTNVVKAAVEGAVETNAGMGRLSEAAKKVGDVVSLISRIAAQTNLLALNATIEAARAGEAGRGFAVVAQEVKTLATQTAKATQDITGQIAEMQEATDLSVDAIDKIQKKISEVEHISTMIASAVHEQGAATQEIARNVRSAAAGTTSMTGHLDNVGRSVSETSTNATAVSTLSRELDDIVIGMTNMVETFKASLRVA
jgi:methyl-accepting chemotaxis protein